MYPNLKGPSFVRRKLSWVLLLVVPYLTSFAWLSWSASQMPFVVLYAPLGLVSLFVADYEARDYSPEVLIVHAIFWPTYLGALIGTARLSIGVLRALFIGLALVITLTCYGCAVHRITDPIKLHTSTTPNNALQRTAG